MRLRAFPTAPENWNAFERKRSSSAAYRNRRPSFTMSEARPAYTPSGWPGWGMKFISSIPSAITSSKRAGFRRPRRHIRW